MTHLRRFAADERGQAILFAAASVMILAGFIAIVFNLGQISERRVQAQLAADGAAYSGAVVQANSLSAIAWTNDGMAQIYTNLTRYAADVCTTGVVAELEHRQGQAGQGVAAYQEAVRAAQEWLPRGKEWLVDLSLIQNCIALVTPRLIQETMYQVACADGMEYVSIYPTARLFPHQGGESHWRVEQFPTGWRITNLSTGEMLWVYKLDGPPREWHVVRSPSGITREEVVIVEAEPGRRWLVRRLDAAGNLVEEVTLIYTGDLGWIVMGWKRGDPVGKPGVVLQFQQVDMDRDGTKEGTRVSDDQGNWQVFKRESGIVYLWDKSRLVYRSITTEVTTLGGVPIHVNVTNVIRFPGATVTVANPSSVSIGPAHIVLSDPPVIETGLGPVRISVRGFDANSFSISVGGFSVNVGSSDGRWRKYFDSGEDLWWRHRLTEQSPVDPAALRQWQYDYELLGAHLRYEANLQRFAVENGLRPRIGLTQPLPEWTGWFDLTPTVAAPFQLQYRQPMLTTPDPVTRLYLPAQDPPQNAYYRTQPCATCGGAGYIKLANNQQQMCATCQAKDHDGDGRSDVRVFLADVAQSVYLRQLRGGDRETYLTAQVYGPNTYGVAAAPDMPLVLTDEFFKYGINAAVWRSPEQAPMLFKREPEWGFVALASARVGVPVPGAGGVRYVYQFDVPGFFDSNGRDVREQWVEDAPENLYRTGLEVRLVSSKRTVDDYDLHHDTSFGTALTPTAENGVSYLWDALMLATYSAYDEPSTWLDEYDGRTNRNIPGLLRNMRDRRGRTFDVRDPQMEDVIFH